jgi:hypothetical protein
LFVATVRVQSEAYRRFATEDLGVALGTWLSEVPESARVLDTVDAILESEADRLQRWQGDGETLPIPAMDSPADFDAVIEDRYGIVSQHYHDVLMFGGGPDERSAARMRVRCAGAGLGTAGDGPSVVHHEGSECVASRLVASDDRGHSM